MGEKRGDRVSREHQGSIAIERAALGRGSIQPSAPTGIGTAQHLGALFRPHLQLYSYAEAFESDAGVLTKMVPDDTCIVGCSNSPATVSYGSISQTEQDGSVHSYSDVKYRSEKALDTARGQGRVEGRIETGLGAIRLDRMEGHQTVNRNAPRKRKRDGAKSAKPERKEK